ncbi:very-long-chain aldehyde decarbonylase GL1-5-like [Triticum dicoccoides]|uniref:very-long-chain aldehyde decarbonylase GL1-5-like n=1 Tax=Triticum dicoccoides TaxID=85692 RepID=UPI000E7C353B|nr:very-long-chain aldehyde decarbonylase GL1-5-like [Triticum dicoccoides]
MATNPGLFSEWPWKRLGSFKYVVLAPWVAHGIQQVASKGWREADLGYLVILPSMMLRALHNQAWITVSRLQNARGKRQIVDRGIEFEQIDRERNWDDQIILSAILFFLGALHLPGGQDLPLWRTDGAVLIALLHAGPVEFIYYWFHRALHHHFLYTRYHSHHHASIVTEPITSVIHPFAELVAYELLFSIPMIACALTGTASIMTFELYMLYIDFMNNMGHCNFELVPTWLFTWFPPLKYLMYTPSFHSLHHTQFRTNYSLFMPFYDYIYSTMDKSSDTLHEKSIEDKEEAVDVVHLTHLTSLQSIYHIRPGFAEFASRPYASKWYMRIMWPLSWLSMVLTWAYGSWFTVERNVMKKLRIQSWAIPRYSFHYGLNWEKEAINNLIVKAICEADKKGAKVVSLGLLNQAQSLNGSGELYLQKYPKLKLKLVDGSSLAAVVVANSIPQGMDQVVLSGNISKVACAVAAALCKKNIKVIITNKQDYHFLQPKIPEDAADNLLLSNTGIAKVWIIGDGADASEQLRAPKGTRFIPYSQFPPRMARKDGCTYSTTPAMSVPKTLQNVHSCENWLPRRVMSAWRVAGIVHALEGWDEHECGDTVLDMDKVWSAALLHGFRPVAEA